MVKAKVLYYFQSLNPEKGEALAEVKKEHVEKLPLRKVSKEQQELFLNLVDQILAAKQRDPAANVAALEAEIDAHVYRLYGLTVEESAVVVESVGR